MEWYENCYVCLQEWFTDTEMYYGYYFDGVIEAISGLKYDMKYAYLCTSGAYYFLTVIILAAT
jgi:hypothetical protein